MIRDRKISMEGNMENNSPVSFKGQFLMAMPSLVDPNFNQTVICICEYTPAGAVGIVIDENSHIMMCGNSAMIASVSECLEKRGLRKHRR